MIIPNRELMPIIRAALERGQRVRMTATGFSMLPSLHDGEVVELEQILGPAKVGDLLLVQCSEDRYVLHRVVRTHRDKLFFKGDACLRVEGPYTRRDVLGRVVVPCHNGRFQLPGSAAWRLLGLGWIRSYPIARRSARFALP